MSREIKFRAWNPKGKKMVTPTYFTQYRDEECHDDWYGGCVYAASPFFDDNENPEDDNHLDWGLSPGTHLILMQYTWITDKNGKVVYEWDLVKSNVNWKLYEIRRLNNHFYCGFVPRAIDWSNENLSFEHEFVIVGNVYENADLLPKK